MKALIITLVLAISTNLTASAQDSTSTSSYDGDECKKFRSLYYQYLKQKMYKDATLFWSKAWTNCGGTDSLDSKFFKNGRVAFLQRIKGLDKAVDTVEIGQINDTITWIYEQRMIVEKDPRWELDYAVMLVTQKNADFNKIDGLFTNIHTLKDKATGTHIRTYFRHLILNKFNSAEGEAKEAERTKVIEEYIVLSDYCAAALKNANIIEDEKKKERSIKSYTAAQDFLDKYFLKIAKDCEVLTPVLDTKFESIADGEAGLAELNKFIALMEKQKCTDSETYSKYVVESVKRNPSAAGYAGLGTIQMRKDETSSAIESYEKAVELEADGENKDKYLLNLSKAQYTARSYKAAASTAKKVGGDGKGDALKIVGDCIAATANSCGNSTFERKTNYWLANDYYKKAAANGANVSSSKYLDNAPTGDDMFAEGISAGASVSCSCWGESTTAR
ncbi:MAG: tetratricopeptide (TPR) repeat protein [Arenicella sp.]|jgi:tetratricopeptide (TPR) repeat protein